MRKRNESPRGFTMVELVVVAAIMLIMMVLGMPHLRKLLYQSKMETTTADIKASFNRARFESIKRSREVVVQALPDTAEVRVYIDEPEFDADGNRTDTPRLFEPNLLLPADQRDRVVAQSFLAKGIDFIAPAGEEAATGLTNLSGGIPADAEIEELVAVYQPPSGSVVDIGAFRVGDIQKNFLEIRVDIAGTGKVISRKFDCEDAEWKIRDGERVDASTSPWIWYWNYDDDC